MRPFQRCLERLTEKDLTHLESYFHVPSEKADGGIQKQIRYSLEPTDTLGILECKFVYEESSISQKRGIEFLQIPVELERLVYSYLQSSKYLSFQIDCSNAFPILPPKIKLQKSNSKELSESFQRIVCKFNSNEWSPALGLDCTLLILLNKLLESVNYV